MSVVGSDKSMHISGRHASSALCTVARVSVSVGDGGGRRWCVENAVYAVCRRQRHRDVVVGRAIRLVTRRATRSAGHPARPNLTFFNTEVIATLRQMPSSPH